jgi:voltage-gated potassium channel
VPTLKRSRQESWALDAVSALVPAPGLRTWLAVVGAALAVGTAGYMLLEGWNLSDALYMTVISVTTAGFREVRTLDESGRVWTMLVTGFGVVLIVGSVGLLTEYLVTEATSGRRVGRHMTRQVDELRGHFVVCGYGRVGSTVAHEPGASPG